MKSIIVSCLTGSEPDPAKKVDSEILTRYVAKARLFASVYYSDKLVIISGPEFSNLNF